MLKADAPDPLALVELDGATRAFVSHAYLSRTIAARKRCSIAPPSGLAEGSRPDWPLTLTLCGAAAVGALLGSSLGRRLSPRILSRAFGVVIAALALFLLADVLVLGGPPTG